MELSGDLGAGQLDARSSVTPEGKPPALRAGGHEPVSFPRTGFAGSGGRAARPVAGVEQLPVELAQRRASVASSTTCLSIGWPGTKAATIGAAGPETLRPYRCTAGDSSRSSMGAKRANAGACASGSLAASSQRRSRTASEE